VSKDNKWKKNMNNIIEQKIPKRIQGLSGLAYNLWWSWHPEARSIFKSLDQALWKVTVHNPVQLLQKISPYRLVAAAEDKDFLQKYDSVMNDFNTDILSEDHWYQTQYSKLSQKTLAYFSMEFAIHSSLPLYAGGLGVLAGDYCKEASDLGLPMVGVGFMYPQGYFKQHISNEGWQEENYQQLNFSESPIKKVLDIHNKPLKISVELDSRTVFASFWIVKIGRVKLYLLDTNLEENSPGDRQLSARLYGGDSEMRLQQEIVLGIGGVRVLRILNIDPVVWHANEGHTSFMMLERCREEIANGLKFDDALPKIKSSTIFTTHTPVPAGNDVFTHNLMEKYFHNYWTSLGLNKESFLALGTQSPANAVFNMTVLSLKMAGRSNGVSRLHGTVCRHMWQGLWPEINAPDIPISSITNGVHLPTWIAPAMGDIYRTYIGPDWLEKHDDPAVWNNIKNIPDEELWEARRLLKNKLVATIHERFRKRWGSNPGSPLNALAAGVLLDPEALTIGFCRRFTDYKRPWLILKDLNRLKLFLQNELSPVQIIFAGKAHPNDHQGKCLIQQVYKLARDLDFRGRIVFMEDYDLHLARYLVQGVDVWLNTPRLPLEASGTSGMKAALNGVPHLSVLDGWWYEGYNGANGWAIHNLDKGQPSDQDNTDAEELYQHLQNSLIPLFYERDNKGIPHGWLRIVKETIRSCAPVFSARRMLKEYAGQMYVPAALSEGVFSEKLAPGEKSIHPESGFQEPVSPILSSTSVR
jgi:glycogen phosphorylase